MADGAVLRRGQTVWEPRTKRWVSDREANVASIQRVISERDASARRSGGFYNQITGRVEPATLANIQSYGNSIAQLRIQDAMANMDNQEDRDVAVHSLRVLQQAEENGTLFGLIGLERVNDDTIIVHSPNLNTVRAAFLLFKGEAVRFEYGFDQPDADPEIVRDVRVDVGINFSSWWHRWSMSIMGSLLEDSSFAIWHGKDWPVRITRLHDVTGVGRQAEDAPMGDGGEGGEDDDDEMHSNDSEREPTRGERFVRGDKIYEFDGENFIHVGDVPQLPPAQPSGAGLRGMSRNTPLPPALVDRILHGYRNHASQRFLDGKYTHCVLGPITDHFAERYHAACEAGRKTETLIMLENVWNKANALLNKYEGVGLSEDELLGVCRDLKIHIVIHLPLQPGGPNAHTFDSHGRVDIARVNKVFHFVNVSFDHLELSHQRCVTLRYNPKDVVWKTHREIFELQQELDDNETFYMFRQSGNVLKTIVTLEQTYRTGRDVEEALGKFYDDPMLLRPVRGAPLDYVFSTFKDMLPFGYDDMPAKERAAVAEHVKTRCMRFRYIYFDVLKEPWKQRFIELSCHWPTWAKADLKSLPSQFVTHDVVELDMRKCYAQHRCARNYNCYRGFLGKITDMGPCTYEDFKEHWVGAYHVVKFDWTGVDAHFKVLHKHWPLFVDSHCYSTPMILYFLERGGKVEIDYGLWGMAFDFEYPEYMFQKQPKVDPEGNIVGEGAALYSLLAGFCSANNDVGYSFKCDPEFLGVLMKNQDLVGEDVRVDYDRYNSIAHVTHKTTSRRGAPQFSLYVTSYAVLHTLEQMRLIPDHRDILAVKSDAILLSTRFYHKNGFGPKPPMLRGYDQDTGCGPYNGGDPNELVRMRLVTIDDVINIKCSPAATIASNIFDPDTNPRSGKWLGDNTVYQQAREMLMLSRSEASMGARGVYEDGLDIGDVRPRDLEECIIQTSCIGDALDRLLTTHGLSKMDMLRLAEGSARHEFTELQQEQELVMKMVSQAPVSKMPPNRNIVGENCEISPNKLFNRQLLVFLGPGGSGKTTSVFGDPRFGSVAMMVVPHCQRNMFKERNADPDDKFVTQLNGPNATEVVACTGKSFELWSRYQQWVERASVFVIDEGSMIQPEKLAEIITQLRGIGKVIVCMDRYQTPPIQLGVGASQRELSDADFEEMGALVHEFWYSYRHEPDDPIRAIIHDMRKDMKEELFDRYWDSTHPQYEAASAALAKRWCDRLMALRGVSMEQVLERMSLRDCVMSYTNHNGRVFDELVNKRRVFREDDDDADSPRMLRWVVHTNAYKNTLKLFNGTVCYQTMSPIAQTEAQIKQHPPEIQQYVLCTKKSAKKLARQKRKRDEQQQQGGEAEAEDEDDEGGQQAKTMKSMQGHGRTRLPCDVRWCDTIHALQGATIGSDRKGWIDLEGMKCIRVLQTAVSRFQRFDQMHFWLNLEARKIASDPESFRGYVYMLRYVENERTAALAQRDDKYIGRTTSMTKVLQNANTRMQQHVRSCKAFVNENQERARMNGFQFSMPAPGVHGWCNSFHVIYPVLETAMEDIEAVILEVFYFQDKNDRRARLILEQAEHKWIEYYQGQGNTNVHGVELT